MILGRGKVQIITFHSREFEMITSQIKFILHKYSLPFSNYKKLKKKRKYTVLRSPHVNKTARDQIELQATVYVIDLNEEIIQLYLFLIQRYFRAPFQCEITRIKNERINYAFTF